MSLSKSSYYYRPKLKPEDKAIKQYLLMLSKQHKRWGFEKMLQKAKLDKKPWNHKRLYRVYCELNLNIRIKPRKRLPKGEARSLMYPITSNICWSMDFMTDVLDTGQRFRTLNIIDDFNREGLAIDIALSQPTDSVISVLKSVIAKRGKPRHIRSDNGPEFISSKFKRWAQLNDIELLYIQPGKPAQNGFIERFNRTYREDILDMYLFSSLTEARQITEAWLEKYNIARPHSSLNGLTPEMFKEKYGQLVR